MALYSTKTAARYLDVSGRTLERYRVAGTGPTFVKLGKLVRYRKEDLDAWVQKSVYASTSEIGVAALVQNPNSKLALADVVASHE